MTFDNLKDRLMPVLHEILEERLKYNRTWNNVKVIEKKRVMKIVWFDPKNPTDHSKIRDVKPFNSDTLTHQIGVQFKKLGRDKYEAGRRE